MRIISGSLKGRRLKAPTWDGLRPTSDKLREAMFNILAPRVPGARVLDGYAGTGAVGIEARSRGASEVVFVERDRRAAALISENLAHCGVTSGCAIMRADIGRLPDPFGTRRFDLILLDPPYAEPDLDAVVARAGAWLAADGLLVLEHARRRETPLVAGDLTRTRVVPSGDSALSFYQRIPAAPGPSGGPAAR
jgi:16S rRNA (guanine966-N2)-methyltransferase